MTLSDEQKELFEHELADYERSHKMPYITSIERSAMAKGREEGRQLGREEALRAAISRLLETRFGKVPDEVAAWLDTLDQAERLLELVTVAATAETLQAWRAFAEAPSS
jgi:predicted transposase YdaD